MSQSYLLAPAAITAVSSGAGSIAAGALQIANATSNLTNSTALNPWWGARLTAAFAVSATQGGQVSLYLAPKFDGTNASAVDTTTPYAPPGLLVGSFYVAMTGTASQVMDLPLIPRIILPYDFIPYLLNSSGQAISAGWSLAFYPARFQQV